ncbi:kinase-like protein, partial [Aspergillus sclerotiicarbonarius CBS 121057]
PVFEVGRTVLGNNGKYKITGRLENVWSMASLFKAQRVEDRHGDDIKWVVIKTRPADSRAALATEYREHVRSGVSSCQNIRPLLDVIPDSNQSLPGMKDANDVHATGSSQVPHGLVFQWMERNLYDFHPQLYRRDYRLAERVLTGVLQALVVFEKNTRTHSDIKPDNVLINCVGPHEYEVKLSDLAEAKNHGFAESLIGSLLTRAPEVWEGKGYFHSSDLWALGVMLFERFNDGAFSFPVMRDDVLIDTIMLAKLMCLFPEWHPSPIENLDVYGQSLGKIFADANHINGTIPILPLDQQLQEMNIPEEWKALLRLLLALDRNKRASASEILQSAAYQAILRNT